MRHIPLLLILLRLGIAAILPVLALIQPAHFPVMAVILITFGLITDIFDGIIARGMNVSTTGLRRLDSFVDQLFWLCIAAAAWIQCPTFFRSHALSLSLLFGLETMAYVVSYVRFGREVATHTISSKFWTLVLFVTLVQIILSCHSGWLYQLCLYGGLATRLEIIAILLLLPRWMTDIPSVYHAMRIRQGKDITRHKLFNG